MDLEAESEPWIEIAARGFILLRDQGASDAEIEAALQRLELENPGKVDPQVLAVVIAKIRHRVGLKPQ
jgi:hypothetical protein